MESPGDLLEQGMAGSGHEAHGGLVLAPSSLLYRRCRRYMALCACASALGFGAMVLACQRMPALPTDFSRTFHRGLNVNISAELFNLTPFACQRTAFCQHLVFDCALHDAATPRGEEISGGCDDVACCLAFPSLAADIQRVYLDRLHRQPDSYGIEYYCKKVSSGALTVQNMRLRMAASPEGQERSKAARVDDYLDQIFGDLPHLLRAMCEAYQTDLCTRAFLRQLLLMLYKGQVNMAYVEQVLRPNSNLWQTNAITFNMMFKEILCREAAPEEFREHHRLLAQVMTLITTWDVIRERWKAGDEGQWCAYRRRVESHALLLSGNRLGGNDVDTLTSEGCSLPVLVAAPGGPEGGGGRPGYPKTPRIALYPREQCMPLFNLVSGATEARALERRPDPHLGHVLRSRDGFSFARARAAVQDAYCEMLGHLPAAHDLSDHLKHLMSWRRTMADVRAMLRGGVEMQYRKQWLDLQRQARQLAQRLRAGAVSAPGAEEQQRQQVALEALAAAVLGGEASWAELASRQHFPDLLPDSSSSARAARRASAFFERTYMQITGQFSYTGDVLLRQRVVAALRAGGMGPADAARVIGHTCLVSDACLECDAYGNLSRAEPFLELPVRRDVAGHGRVAGGEEAPQPIAAANPCCCSGGKLRADLLELYAHDSAQKVSVLDSLGNSTMQGALLGMMRDAFGKSETGVDHMSALVNRHLAPPTLASREPDITHCIVLYVHNRPNYFRQVLDHLRAVTGIKRALLVVSFDGLFGAMLEVAKSIDFCRVRFLVHTSRQTFAHMSSLVAIKEHWWWLVEQVFTVVPEMRRRDGYVLFLEEDHILSADALTVVSALTDYIKGGGCSSCWGVSLRFGCSEPDASDATGVCLADGFVNTGYAFNRSLFDTLQRHNDSFWAFSEGWDFTIFHLIQVGLARLPPPPLRITATRFAVLPSALVAALLLHAAEDAEPVVFVCMYVCVYVCVCVHLCFHVWV